MPVCRAVQGGLLFPIHCCCWCWCCRDQLALQLFNLWILNWIKSRFIFKKREKEKELFWGITAAFLLPPFWLTDEQFVGSGSTLSCTIGLTYQHSSTTTIGGLNTATAAAAQQTEKWRSLVGTRQTEHTSQPPQLWPFCCGQNAQCASVFSTLYIALHHLLMLLLGWW